jgi:hypothetical protein
MCSQSSSSRFSQLQTPDVAFGSKYDGVFKQAWVAKISARVIRRCVNKTTDKQANQQTENRISHNGLCLANN